MAGNKTSKLAGLISLLTLVFIAIILTDCKDKPFASQSLRFILPITIQPFDSVRKLGDTIWIEASISDSLLEFNSNKKYKLANFDFGQTSIAIRELNDNKKGLSDQKSAVSNFVLIDNTGQITFPGETFIDFKFRYAAISKKYLLQIGIIPQSKGVFCINFLPPTELLFGDDLDLGISSNGAKVVAVYDYLVFPINEGINNFELFKRNCLDQSQGPATNYWTNYRYVTFTFRVI